MEKEMFPIIKNFLEEQDYKVKAEVKSFDIMGMKEDVILIVEMKNTFNTKLICQGLEGKYITDYVYLAIPKPTVKVMKSASFKEKKQIIKSLELGLLLVDKQLKEVIVLLDPLIKNTKKKNKKRENLKKEFLLRKTDFNEGGVSRTKIITAYRELALITLHFLKDGPKTTKEIKTFVKQDKVMSVLQQNYYGWFERIERGVYQITNIGVAALKSYEKVLDKLIN